MNKEQQFGLLKHYGIVKTEHKTGKLVEVIYKTVVIEGKKVKMARKETVLETGEWAYLQMRKKYYINKGYQNLKITR